MIDKSNLYKNIGLRITDAMKQQGVTTAALIELCSALGYGINHSTISKIRQGLASMSVMNLVYICKALNLDLNYILSLDDNEKTTDTSREETIVANVDKRAHETKQPSEVFISDPDDWKISPYLGTYYGYYCSAAIPRDKIEEVEINIRNPNNGSRITEVEMTYETPFNGPDGHGRLRRKYVGSLTLSEKAATVYCSLSCNETGKQFHFAFLHNRKVYERGELETIVCAVLATNRGDNYAPTIQRMLLTRKRLGLDKVKLIRSQLKLNDQMILISKVDLKDAVNDSRCSSLIKQRLCDGGNVDEWVNQLQYTPYFEIGESYFDMKFNNELDRSTVVNVLREHSRDVYYNKVSEKASIVARELVSAEGEKVLMQKSDASETSKEQNT